MFTLICENSYVYKLKKKKKKVIVCKRKSEFSTASMILANKLNDIKKRQVIFLDITRYVCPWYLTEI